MELKFRVRCLIFPNWVYSESHYNFCDFWDRINAQYLSDDWDVELEQEVNGEWISVTVKQAEKDIKLFGPKKYKSLSDLQPNDTFRYKGSDENDWHVVSKVDDKKLYYAGVNNEQSNYRVENVEIIVK